MKPMQAGKLRTRIAIQRNLADPNNAADRNASAELIPRWATVFYAWAAVEPLSGREFWNAVQVQADVTHKITLWYRPDQTLSADMRAVTVKGSRVFNFNGPPRNIEELNVAWEILAVEVVANPVGS